MPLDQGDREALRDAAVILALTAVCLIFGMVVVAAWIAVSHMGPCAGGR